MLTQERLKELLTYNPDTGVFTWIDSKNKHREEAGYLNYKGYMLIDIDGKKHRSHRLAFLYMTGSFPKEQVDHINHGKTDNRWSNLRMVSNTENHKNMKMQSNNTSGVTGVSWERRRDKWVVRIKDCGKYLHLGYFEDFFEAICTRKSAEIRYNYHENHGINIQGA